MRRDYDAMVTGAILLVIGLVPFVWTGILALRWNTLRKNGVLLSAKVTSAVNVTDDNDHNRTRLVCTYTFEAPLPDNPAQKGTFTGDFNSPSNPPDTVTIRYLPSNPKSNSLEEEMNGGGHYVLMGMLGVFGIICLCGLWTIVNGYLTIKGV